jgi:hypothetical protein
MADRVRIIFSDGRISVVDKEFSQVCAMTRDWTKEEKDAFWRQERVVRNGDDFYLVREGV